MFEGLFGKRRQIKAYSGFAAKTRPAPDRSMEKAALDYHRAAPAGKMSTQPTKPLENQYDLSLAYSPGVAAASRAIVADPRSANALTARGNLVAVVSNGTAVLGLGDVGPLAAKPVMEGKAALFHRFGGVNAIDLEFNEKDPRKLAAHIIALEPSVGGINLEDIRAPDCFLVEEICRREMNIPVFHDDQHGTAVCVLAALENALLLTDRRIGDIRLVCSGAGAAALATLDLLFARGLARENVLVTDRNGVIYKGRRQGMSAPKEKVAVKTQARTLQQALKGADVFLGLSAGGLLHPKWISAMNDRPIILALANPDPEVWPDDAIAVAPDAIIATGRSDFPNQVNNVVCFPYIFRGAFDAGAKSFTREMFIAAADTIASIARMDPTAELAERYPGEDLRFGVNSIMPRPFDPRLRELVPAAVATSVSRR